MLKAYNVMTHKVVAVPGEMPMYEATRLIIEKQIGALPVVTGDNTLVGILTDKDILEWLDELEQDSAKVGERMTGGVTCFNENDDLMEICESMIENQYRRIPITANGKLVGIISRKDIIRYVMQMQEEYDTKVISAAKEG